MSAVSGACSDEWGSFIFGFCKNFAITGSIGRWEDLKGQVIIGGNRIK